MESTPGAVTVLRPRWHFWATISLGLVCVLAAIVLVEVWFSVELTDGLVSTLLSAPLTTVSLANLMGAGLFFLGSAIHGRLRPERLVLSDQGLLIDTRKRRRFVHWDRSQSVPRRDASREHVRCARVGPSR